MTRYRHGGRKTTIFAKNASAKISQQHLKTKPRFLRRTRSERPRRLYWSKLLRRRIRKLLRRIPRLQTLSPVMTRGLETWDPATRRAMTRRAMTRRARTRRTRLCCNKVKPHSWNGSMIHGIPPPPPPLLLPFSFPPPPLLSSPPPPLLLLPSPPPPPTSPPHLPSMTHGPT